MHHVNESSLVVDDERNATAPDPTDESPATRWHERGAALVEFAIVLPILLTLVFGIIEYGRAYEVKVQLTGGVREGARALALGKTSGQATQAVKDAAPGINLAGASFTNTACPAGGADGNATVKISYSLPSLTPLIPSGSINLTATGVMRCGL
jgi:Flp pilus assembly protein TadG